MLTGRERSSPIYLGQNRLGVDPESDETLAGGRTWLARQLPAKRGHFPQPDRDNAGRHYLGTGLGGAVSEGLLMGFMEPDGQLVDLDPSPGWNRERVLLAYVPHIDKSLDTPITLWDTVTSQGLLCLTL